MDIQRLSEADRISSLLLKKMAGTLTQEEKAEVDAWTAQSQQRQTYADLLGDTNYLQEEYHRQKDIDAHQALRQMQQRIDGNRPASPMVLRYAIAAALTALIVGGLFWYWQYAKVVPPTISTEVQQAMAQSQQSGRDAAEVATGTLEELASDLHGFARTGQSVNPAQQQESVSVRVTPMQIDDAEAVRQLLTAKRITTRSDREFWLTLPDGSLVHLNYNTRVIYPERFIGDTRDVILDGEAYFMVAKDRRHPFIVHTPQGDVKEYGTEFNVSTRGEAGTEVVLVEGSISVTPTNGTEQMMHPGQKLSILNSQFSIDEVDVEPYIAWNTGKFSFENCALEKLMSVVSKWYGYRVEYDDEATRQLTFTGELDKYSSVEPVLHAISKTMNLHVEMDKGNIFISKN